MSCEPFEDKCISSGLFLNQGKLLRFVVAPDNSIALDLTQKLPGENFWIAACHKTLKAAIEEDAFSREANKKINIPENLTNDVESALVERCISALGLARRAGCLIWGFKKVENALRKQNVLLRIEASDGSLAEKRKLDSISIVPVLQSLYANELARILNRPNIVHLAISDRNVKSSSGLVTRLTKDFDRLAIFRTSM